MTPAQINDRVEAIHYRLYECKRDLAELAPEATGQQRRDIVEAGRAMHRAWEKLEATIHNQYRRTHRG